MTYSDEHLEFWGEVYTSNRPLRGYCSFSRFLARPRYYVENVGRAPLLEQLAVRRRIDAQHHNGRHP